MEQRPVGSQCKKNGNSINDKALQRIKACNNGMHNAESRSVVSYIVGRCVCQRDRLHEWLQFYINDTIMQSEQEKEAVEMAQSICREALQVTQVKIARLLHGCTLIKTKCKENSRRKLSKLRSRFFEMLYKCGSKWIDWKKDSIKSESISSVSATASRLNFYQNGVRRRQKEAAQIRMTQVWIEIEIDKSTFTGNALLMLESFFHSINEVQIKKHICREFLSNADASLSLAVSSNPTSREDIRSKDLPVTPRISMLGKVALAASSSQTPMLPDLKHKSDLPVTRRISMLGKVSSAVETNEYSNQLIISCLYGFPKESCLS
ncbi:hypothetical protein T01_5116 [Trichinella spiralis]|uniref:Uncharacterized protein n=1 Tax=Trichinella spiralis TaxID=6334 RepID=A0A0V1B7F5_TRISP|nr:hypothetical protein T01_5116 [Trichinella spiralis]